MKLRFPAVSVALLATCFPLFGAISFELVTWDNEGDEVGWVTLGGVADVQRQASGGNPPSGGFLQLGLNFEPPGGPPEDIVYRDSADYQGDYTGYQNLALRFDLRGFEEGIHRLYFESDYGATSSWGFDIDVTSDSWQSYTVGFTGADAWEEISETGIDFSDALTDVALIGLSFKTPGDAGEYLFGLDNWKFFLNDHVAGAVPEPGAVAFLGTALASAMLGYGRRKRKTVPPPA